MASLSTCSLAQGSLCHGLLAYLSLSEVTKHLLLLLNSFVRVPMVEMCVSLVTPVFAVIPQIFPPPPGRPWESGGWRCAEPKGGHAQLHSIPSNTAPSALFSVPLPPPSKTVSRSGWWALEVSAVPACHLASPHSLSPLDMFVHSQPPTEGMGFVLIQRIPDAMQIKGCGLWVLGILPRGGSVA